MKITVELEDELYRRGKSAAQKEDKKLPELMAEALQQRLDGVFDEAAGRPWMRAFGGLAACHEETADVRARAEAIRRQSYP